VTTGTLSHAKLQLDHTTNVTALSFFTGRMPFLSVNCIKAQKAYQSKTNKLKMQTEITKNLQHKTANVKK